MSTSGHPRELAAESSRIEAALNEAFVEDIHYEAPLGLTEDASEPSTLGYLVVGGIIFGCTAQLPDDALDAPFVSCEGPVPALTPETDRFSAAAS